MSPRDTSGSTKACCVQVRRLNYRDLAAPLLFIDYCKHVFVASKFFLVLPVKLFK